MSHLLKMIRDEDTFIKRLNRAHSILFLEMESTSEVIIFTDAEACEKLWDEFKYLLSQMPEEFRTATLVVDDLERSMSTWWGLFHEGFENFIIKMYQGEQDMSFVNTTRAVLHYASIYLEREK